jgi:hypothetical protein
MSEQATEILESEEARKERVMRHRVELLNAAGKTEAFQELVRECDRWIDYQKKLLTQQALGPEPFDQRVADFTRGQIAGIKYVQQVVRLAKQTIQQLNEEQEALDAASQPEPEPTWRTWT